MQCFAVRYVAVLPVLVVAYRRQPMLCPSAIALHAKAMRCMPLLPLRDCAGQSTAVPDIAAGPVPIAPVPSFALSFHCCPCATSPCCADQCSSGRVPCCPTDPVQYRARPSRALRCLAARAVLASRKRDRASPGATLLPVLASAERCAEQHIRAATLPCCPCATLPCMPVHILARQFTPMQCCRSPPALAFAFRSGAKAAAPLLPFHC